MSWLSHLDGLHQVGRAVGHLLGRLDEVPLGHGVGRFGRCDAAGVAQGRGVLGHDGGRRQDLKQAGWGGRTQGFAYPKSRE